MDETEDVEIHPDEPPELPGLKGDSSTAITYALKLTNTPAPGLGQIVAVATATAVYTILSWLTIISLPSGISIISSVFLAIGFGIPFALWFGGWAFVIAYIGNFVGAGLLAGLPLLLAIPFGTVDLLQLGLPMLLYRLFARRFGISPIGKDVYTVRGFLFFLVAAVLVNNILGGLYGNLILIWGGINPANTLLPGWFAWSLSNVVITLVIGSILLRTLGPAVERFGLTVRNFLS
ncbi:MAG: hypothetical protein ABI396_08125 [Ktedonobacteraceae bacterium]